MARMTLLGTRTIMWRGRQKYSWGFMKVTVELQKAVEFGQKCIFSFTFSAVLTGNLLTREEAGMGTKKDSGLWAVPDES